MKTTNRQELIEILKEFLKEEKDPKAWEDGVWGTPRFAVKRFYEKYADKIESLYGGGKVSK